MPADPAEVVTALRKRLPATVEVRLDDVNGRPHAVVTHDGLRETWVDLWTSTAAQPDADASSVAEAIVQVEGWPHRAE